MVGPLQRLVGLLILLAALGVGLVYVPDRPVEALVARWAPPPSDFIDLDGQLVHVRDVGPRDDPEPLVLLHGTAASLHTWEGWVQALSARHRVITLDLLGFGLTGPDADGDYHGDTEARFVLKLLDRLQVQRFAIGGNSFGGEVAWRTASLAPQRVARLVLVDATGYGTKPKSIPLAFWFAGLPVVHHLADFLTPRALVEDSVREVYGDPAKVTPELVDRYYELALRDGNRRALSESLQQRTHGEDAARIAALKLPTLVLWGGRDRLVPIADAHRFQHDIAGSRLVVFDGLGHVPQEEDPARTVAPVEAFLEHGKP